VEESKRLLMRREWMAFGDPTWSEKGIKGNVLFLNGVD
jgi:hypothetical protein